MNRSANLCRKEWWKQREWNKHHEAAKTIAGVDNYVVKNVKNPGWITSGGTLFLFLADSGTASYQAFLLNIGSNFWIVGIGHFPSGWMLLSLNCQKLIVTLNNSFLLKECYKNSSTSYEKLNLSSCFLASKPSSLFLSRKRPSINQIWELVQFGSYSWEVWRGDKMCKSRWRRSWEHL